MSLEIEPNAGCSEYCDSEGYDAEWLNTHKCHCPVCKGFLAWDENGQPHCNKCGIELLLVPDIDETTKEETGWGKICAVGKPKPKEKAKEDLETKRLCKQKADEWKGWL